MTTFPCSNKVKQAVRWIICATKNNKVRWQSSYGHMDDECYRSVSRFKKRWIALQICKDDRRTLTYRFGISRTGSLTDGQMMREYLWFDVPYEPAAHLHMLCLEQAEEINKFLDEIIRDSEDGKSKKKPTRSSLNKLIVKEPLHCKLGLHGPYEISTNQFKDIEDKYYTRKTCLSCHQIRLYDQKGS